MLRIAALTLLLLLSGQVLAQERVLHCTETDSAGFLWQEGQTEGHTRFSDANIENRYIVKTLDNRHERAFARAQGREWEEKLTITSRMIFDVEGTIFDLEGKPEAYVCIRPLPKRNPGLRVCNNKHGTEPWLFEGTSFVRASMLGPPVNRGRGDSISVSYGLCTEVK